MDQSKDIAHQERVIQNTAATMYVGEDTEKYYNETHVIISLYPAASDTVPIV